MGRRTRIIVTLGPRSWDSRTIKSMIAAGADIVRLNLSFAKSEQHYAFLAKVVRHVRETGANFGKTVTIMVDCPGHKFRLRQFAEREVHVGDMVELSADDKTNGALPFPYRKLLSKMQVGQEVLIADGQPRFKITRTDAGKVIGEITLGGFLEPDKGLTVRGLKISSLNLPALSKADKRGLQFAVDVGAEEVVMSYGTSAKQTLSFSDYYRRLGGKGKIRVKIELEEAVERVEEVAAVSDGGLVGQGDLGLSVSHQRVVTAGTKVVRTYLQAGKPCYVGTQLGTSMKQNPFLTHGETAGIFYWVYTRADGLMVSDETSMGKHPVRVVEALDATIREAESFFSNSPA